MKVKIKNDLENWKEEALKKIRVSTGFEPVTLW